MKSTIDINMIAPTPTLSSSSSNLLLRDCDIVCGRGGLANKHPGNRLLRRICNKNRELYQSSLNPVYKHCMIVSIFTAIQQNGGSFVTRTKDGSWKEISDKQAKEKTAQLLRELESSSSTSSTSSTQAITTKPKITKSTIKFDTTFFDESCNDCLPILQAPRTRQPTSLVSPETTAVKGLYTPNTLSSEDLSNLLRQPLLQEPEAISSAPPMLVFENGDVEAGETFHGSVLDDVDSIFDLIALEAGEASDGMEFSHDFRDTKHGLVSAYSSAIC
ncbi:MAG: hypothetical protein SGBAC_001177 [Bacillariaceae sp.]